MGRTGGYNEQQQMGKHVFRLVFEEQEKQRQATISVGGKTRWGLDGGLLQEKPAAAKK